MLTFLCCRAMPLGLDGLLQGSIGGQTLLVRLSIKGTSNADLHTQRQGSCRVFSWYDEHKLKTASSAT